MKLTFTRLGEPQANGDIHKYMALISGNEFNPNELLDLKRWLLTALSRGGDTELERRSRYCLDLDAEQVSVSKGEDYWELVVTLWSAADCAAFTLMYPVETSHDA